MTVFSLDVRCDVSLKEGGHNVGSIQSLNLSLISCREILDRYSNMASATVLFVLDKVRKDNAGRTDKPWTLALAFGPGISVEGAFMRLVA